MTRLVALVVLECLTLVPALAQTAPTPPLFAPASATVDYDRGYATVEECFAAVARVRDSVHWGTTRATTPAFDPARWDEGLGVDDPRRPEPPAVVATARRCAARFTVPGTAPADLPYLQQLLLEAGRDSLAFAVLGRRLTILPAGAPVRDRARILRAALNLMLEVRPARLVAAEGLLPRLDALGPEAGGERLRAYVDLTALARTVYDTTRLDRYVNAMIALADSLSSPDPRLTGLARAVRQAGMNHRRMRALARGEPVAPESGATPPLHADFRFRQPDSTASRPTPGKPSLLVFVEQGCEDGCRGVVALRELHERLRDSLEITLVTHTHGYFRNHPPLIPVKEAELVGDHLFHYLRLPGALLVETTPFQRLPPPDGRRVDHPPANFLNYLPRKPEEFDAHNRSDMYGVLVGRDGRVLLRFVLGQRSWRLLVREAIVGYATRSALGP